MKPSVSEVIVVEGRYDKNTLLQTVDATVLELGGFGVYNDKEKLALLRRLAETRGLIVFTDPDGAGFQLRNYLKGALPADKLKHAYVPDVFGKEKRKASPGKEGKLGVEGMRPEVLLAALRDAGATIDGERREKGEEITHADLMERGLIGAGSREVRARLLKALSLPERLTTNGMLEVLNLLMNREDFFALEF
ncbi:MAG: DUF4093 domain-containing protein [Oscillospiraceae bacterium]|nr:DUF4093 domain-containing protein [Oscillospiraceae bacterium]